MITRTTEDASPEFLQKERLQAELVERLRSTLTDGRWEISGRVASQPRRVLERVDIINGRISWEANAIGDFQHIQIREQRAETNREVMQRFIERICSAAGQPGTALTKPVISDLACRLFPEQFTATDFAVAWREANIGDAWRDPGPRRRQSESD